MRRFAKRKERSNGCLEGKTPGAFLIDVVIVSVFSGVAVTALFAAASQADEGVAIATFILGAGAVLALIFAYKFVLELTPWRATFGKKALGIRIVAADGTEAGAGAIIWREILYAVFSGISTREPGLRDHAGG